MAGLFPCSWSQPLVRRNIPEPFNYACNLPVKPKSTRLYLPAVIPADEICPLVDDYELEQTVQQIQSETDANYDPAQVLNMTKEFNRNLDNTIEILNTTPPHDQPVLEPPQLLDLMVVVSKYSHVLEECIKKNQSQEGKNQ